MLTQNIIKEGRAVWIPCDIKAGIFPTESYIEIIVPERKPVTGFVPTEEIRRKKEAKGQVRAVIAQLLGDWTALVFRRGTAFLK